MGKTKTGQTKQINKEARLSDSSTPNQNKTEDGRKKENSGRMPYENETTANSQSRSLEPDTVRMKKRMGETDEDRILIFVRKTSDKMAELSFLPPDDDTAKRLNDLLREVDEHQDFMDKLQLCQRVQTCQSHLSIIKQLIVGKKWLLQAQNELQEEIKKKENLKAENFMEEKRLLTIGKNKLDRERNQMNADAERKQKLEKKKLEEEWKKLKVKEESLNQKEKDLEKQKKEFYASKEAFYEKIMENNENLRQTMYSTNSVHVNFELPSVRGWFAKLWSWIKQLCQEIHKYRQEKKKKKQQRQQQQEEQQQQEQQQQEEQQQQQQQSSSKSSSSSNNNNISTSCDNSNSNKNNKNKED